MLSKLLTTTALGSVLSQSGVDHFNQADQKFGELYKSYACQLANMTPEDASNYHNDWVQDLIDHEHIDNVRNPDRFEPIAGETLVASAARECERVTNLPTCDGDADDAPGSNCRQLNQLILSGLMGGYGCWGNFPASADIIANGFSAYSSIVANGRGPPKDDLDRAARDLTQSYKCIMEEYILETGNSCNPWEEIYTPTIPPPFSAGGIAGWTAQCELNHGTVGGPSSCKVKACLVETLFTAKYIAWSYDIMNANGGQPVPNDDTTYWHAGAAWNIQSPYSGTPGQQFENTAANCPTSGPVVHVYCCGAYPFRQRLHSATSTDQCCNGDVYNDTTHKCCGDDYWMGDVGTVETIASAVC